MRNELIKHKKSFDCCDLRWRKRARV
jgi:hypothetical protein